MSSVIVGDWRRLYVAGAPRFMHKGKVILFDLTPEGDVIITQALNGEQVDISPSFLYVFILTPSTFTHSVSGPQMRSPSNPCVMSNSLSFTLSFFSQLIFYLFSSLSPSFTPHSCSLTINEFIFLLNKSKWVSFSQTTPKIKVILKTKSRGSGFPQSWKT